MYICRCTTQNYADDVRYYVQVISDFCDIYCRRTSEAVVDEVGAANACFRPYMVCFMFGTMLYITIDYFSASGRAHGKVCVCPDNN